MITFLESNLGLEPHLPRSKLFTFHHMNSNISMVSKNDPSSLYICIFLTPKTFYKVKLIPRTSYVGIRKF